MVRSTRLGAFRSSVDRKSVDNCHPWDVASKSDDLLLLLPVLFARDRSCACGLDLGCELRRSPGEAAWSAEQGQFHYRFVVFSIQSDTRFLDKRDTSALRSSVDAWVSEAIPRNNSCGSYSRRSTCTIRARLFPSQMVPNKCCSRHRPPCGWQQELQLQLALVPVSCLKPNPCE